MREIRFRGKRADIDWKYGYLTIIEKPKGTASLIAIKPLDEQWITYGVDPDSVGEFTGLKDKARREIYEGDVVSWVSSLPGSDKAYIMVVTEHRGAYCTKDEYGSHSNLGWCGYVGDEGLLNLEVIGNVYENGEPLNGEQ